MICIIRIQERYQFPGHDIKTGIASTAQSLVRLVNDPDPAVSFRISVTDLPGTVRGTVINDDDLQVFVRLIHNTVQCLSQIWFHIIYRHDNTDQTIIIHFVRFLQ